MNCKNRIWFDGPRQLAGVEKITDQQRSFYSNQAVLLAENHPENIEFRYTERSGRHLISSVWYRTLTNCERVKRSWLIFSKSKNAIFCACYKIYQKPSSTSGSYSIGFINWKKVSEILTEHEATQMHKECMIKWKTRLQQMKSCQVIIKMEPDPAYCYECCIVFIHNLPFFFSSSKISSA